MNVICDNPYFLLGLKSLYGDMKEVFCKHKPSDTICIISSSVFSEIYQFYSKINIADENVTFYASPSAVRCLSGITVRDVYNMSFFIPGFRNKENEDRRLTSNTTSEYTITQKKIMLMIICGFSIGQCARIMRMPYKTCYSYKWLLMRKLMVNNDIELFYKLKLLMNEYSYLSISRF